MALHRVQDRATLHAYLLLQTMRELLLHGAAAFGLSDYVIVDCRYDYEYQGGRLPGGHGSRAGG